MAEAIAALVVRILTDTSEMVTGVKKASTELDGFENNVVDVDRALREISGASGQASGAVGGLTGTYRQFDGVLQAAGINIGPQVKGLEDIANAAGKSASQIGAVGTAGLVMGAGMVGWGVGRAIADFFDLDEAIAQTAASLLGFGDLAAETAGAQMDTINRAIAAGAAETISYAKAVEFLITAKRQEADAYAVSSARLAAAQAEVRGLNEATIDGIVIAQQAGATQQEITRHFGVSADALRVLADRQRDAAKAAAEHKRENEDLGRSYDKLIRDVKTLEQMAIFDRDADTQRRRRSNDQQLDLMMRDDELIRNRRAFDDSEAIETNRIDWERRYFAERDAIDRSNAAMVSGSSPTSITIDARGSYWDTPDRINQMARMVEDAIARRSGLVNTYNTRR